jgi:hypothetical protein
MEMDSDFAISESLAFNPFQMASLRFRKSVGFSPGTGLKIELVWIISYIYKKGIALQVASHVVG